MHYIYQVYVFFILHMLEHSSYISHMGSYYHVNTSPMCTTYCHACFILHTYIYLDTQVTYHAWGGFKMRGKPRKAYSAALSVYLTAHPGGTKIQALPTCS